MAENESKKPTGAYVVKDIVTNEVMNMIGTTPTHTFGIPFDASLLKSVMIIYAQNDVEILCKKTEDCTLEGNVIKVTLTQEDTFKFNHRQNVQIQARLLTTRGEALKSGIKVVDVSQCLNDEVLI